MRGQLLLGEKRWKERRDLARPDETSSVAHCFVSWVFLSFSPRNFRSVSPSESPGPPLRADREKRRRHPAPAPPHPPSPPHTPPPTPARSPGPRRPVPRAPPPRRSGRGSSSCRAAVGRCRRGRGSAEGAGWRTPKGLGQLEGGSALAEGCSSISLEAHLEGAFLPTQPPPAGSWASGWLLGRNRERDTAATQSHAGTYGVLAGKSALLPTSDTWAERLLREAGVVFCRGKSINEQSYGASEKP